MDTSMDTSSNQPTLQQDNALVNTEDPEFGFTAVIKKRLHDLDPISASACIYRVPPTLRQVSEKSYTPQIVSIGPFHHGKEELGRWEEYKLRYLKAFLYHTQKSLEDCIKFVKDSEKRARNCYREKIGLSSHEFVNMMLVDSSFIIEVMRRTTYNWGETTDYLSNPELTSNVKRDLILLENQIPFFVLYGLFNLGFGGLGVDKFIKLSIQYFHDQLLTETEYRDAFQNVKRHQESGFEIEHLTDLLRICHLPSDLQKDKGNFVSIPTAARLQEAGMKFKIGTSKRLLDMKYNKTTGVLEIPKFVVQDSTECLLRNLAALETCHYPFDSYIIDYIYFMDNFIDTATDADLLIQEEIIENFLSDSAAVASLFNNLGMEYQLFGEYYFTSLSEGLKKYCDVRWHKWKATFKRDYCGTPWMIAATASAIILLVLTLISTICSVISLF